MSFKLLNLKCFSVPNYTKYLHTLLQDFYSQVIRLIDKSMKTQVDVSVRGVMASEIHKHLHFCNESAKKFLGREFQLYKVQLYFALDRIQGYRPTLQQ